MNTESTKLSATQQERLLQTVKARFAKHPDRHKNIAWSTVEQRLLADPEKMRSLFEMEETGGEPDVVGINKRTGAIIFYDCAAESPKNRRSLCYDNEALLARKEHKPQNSAVGMAEEIGITLLTEDQYRELQTLGDFDLKTSSWLHTPEEMRQLGGALFGDKRFSRVFTYHNGVQSYYAGRGFRGALEV